MHESVAALPPQQQQQNQLATGRKARQKGGGGGAVEADDIGPEASEKEEVKKKAKRGKASGDREGEGDGIFAPAEEYEHLTGAKPPQGLAVPKRRKYKKAEKKTKKGS